MIKYILFVLILFSAFSIKAQETIIESSGTITVPNEVFQNETTKVLINLDNTVISWGDAPSSTSFRVSVSLITEQGVILGSHTQLLNASVLDVASGSVDFHDYIRNQIFTLVELVDPYGLTVWNKLY